MRCAMETLQPQEQKDDACRWGLSLSRDLPPPGTLTLPWQCKSNQEKLMRFFTVPWHCRSSKKRHKPFPEPCISV